MSSSSQNKATILVVDDSRVVLKIMERILLDEYQVLTASNGKEALEVLDKRPDVRLIISDLWMPVMDGFEFLTNLKQSPNPKIKAIPIVVVSASQVDAPVRQKLEQLNASAIIRKPVTTEKIRAVVSRVAMVSEPSLETMFMMQPTMDALFPVLDAHEIRANLGQFFNDSNPDKTTHCLAMFRVIEQSFTGQDTTREIVDKVYETLNNGIRDTDCFLRHANKGFLFVMAGIGRDVHRKRAEYLLKRLALKLSEDQRPFNKFYLHMSVLPFNSSRMNEADMWELFAHAQQALNAIKRDQTNAILFEDEQKFYNSEELIKRRA